MVKFSFLNRMNGSGIRAHLAGLVAGCILPIAAVAVFLILNFYQDQKVQLENNATSRARALMMLLDRDFASTQAALQALGTSHRLATGDLGGFHARALEVLPSIHAENIVVWDAAGQMLLTTSLPYQEKGGTFISPPVLKRTLELAEPGVSDLYLDPVSGYLTFSISVPIKQGGVTPYSLNSSVESAQLERLLKEQKFPDSWRASIIDSTGSVVARSLEIEKFQGKKVSAGLLVRLNAAFEGAEEGKTLDGTPVLTVYSRSRVTYWAVVLGIPQKELSAGLGQSLTWLIVVTLAALLVGISWAWHFGGRVAGSVTALIPPARALGCGEFVALPELDFKEARELGQALLDAAGTLKRSQYMAQHDALTGLPNRAQFEAAVNQQLAVCRRNHSTMAILYLDLDGFKAVNDAHGHDTGDQLLCQVAQRLKNMIRASDIAARLGGDEFALALIHSDANSAETFGKQLIETLSKDYQLGAVNASISASIGVAAFPVSAEDIDTLLIRADKAMYQAKAAGKGRVCVALNSRGA
ncbi:MAG: sensor domain-containing diguanylate cyclase [Comamonadaceae bacterium]